MEHIEMEKIASFAEKKMGYEIFDDEDLKIQEHMAECDLCYQKMCLYFMLLDMTDGENMKSLLDAGIEEQKMENVYSKTSNKQKVVAVFQAMCSMAEKKIDLVQEYFADSVWRFRQSAVLAVARGVERKQEKVMYSLQSPQSYLQVDGEEKKIYISLEASDYPEGEYQLAVITEESTIVYELAYDEEEEVYSAWIPWQESVGNIRLELRKKI